MKTISLTITTILIISNLAAQEIIFKYDDSGNRISRKLIVQKQDTSTTIAKNKSVNNFVYNNRTNINTTVKQTDISSNTKKIDKIDELNELNIKVYPNPVETMLIVKLENVENFDNSNVQLYNTSGKLLHTKKIGNSVSHIDMQTYSQGVYILIVMSGTKKSEYKIIKK